MTDLVPAGFPQGRYVAFARLLLALVALTIQLITAAGASPFYAVALCVFCLYALLGVAKAGTSRGVFELLALFADTVFFLILANRGTVPTLWFSAAFYMYLLFEATLFYSPREVFVVVVVCNAFGVAAPGADLAKLRHLLVGAGSLACGFSLAGKRREEELREASETAAKACDEAERARESERERIAADFHDGPLQNFISIQMRLEILRRILERDKSAAMQELQQLQAISQAQVRELRAFVRSMRPAEVDATNLVASVRRVTEDFQKESGIAVTFNSNESAVAVTVETASEVVQMTREALHNIQKHAGATRAAVTLHKNGRTLEVSVDDNGRGFQFAGEYNLDELDLLRLGPVSLKRRARTLNADFVLESHPGRGAGIKLRIPI